MFNLKMKVYDLQYRYFTRRKKKMLKRAEMSLNEHDFEGHEKYMKRARRYMAKIVQVSKKREDLELN